MFVFSTLQAAAIKIATTLVKIILAFAKALWWIVRKTARAILAVAKPAMQYLAFLFLVTAVLALVADLTPSSSVETPASTFTSLTQHWNAIAPRTLKATEHSVTTSTAPWVWQTLELLILNFPTFFVFGVFGMLAAYAGRRRKILDVFVN